MRAALVSLPCCADADLNTAKCIAYAERAAGIGCRVICFPEGAITGYFPALAQERALCLDDSRLKKLLCAAERLGIDIIAGFEERLGGALYMTQGVFTAGGLKVYRKTHPAMGERAYFAAGDSLPVFALSCATVGIELCAETHFPDITQTLSLRGAEIVFAPYASGSSPADRTGLWKKYIPARAYDNRVFMLCCGLCGEREDGARFSGGLFAAGLDGETIYEDSSGAESFAAVELCPGVVEKYRASASMAARYYPALRRKELYE